jgi:hypothetical protein
VNREELAALMPILNVKIPCRRKQNTIHFFGFYLMFLLSKMFYEPSDPRGK